MHGSGDKATQSQHIGITYYRSPQCTLIQVSGYLSIPCVLLVVVSPHRNVMLLSYGFAFPVVGTGVPIKHNYFVYYKHTLEGSILYCLFQEKVSIML